MLGCIQVREMRLVRREDARGVCLVLLRFCDVETAAGFYDNYNGRPVRQLPSALDQSCSSASGVCKQDELFEHTSGNVRPKPSRRVLCLPSSLPARCPALLRV